MTLINFDYYGHDISLCARSSRSCACFDRHLRFNLTLSAIIYSLSLEGLHTSSLKYPSNSYVCVLLSIDVICIADETIMSARSLVCAHIALHIGWWRCYIIDATLHGMRSRSLQCGYETFDEGVYIMRGGVMNSFSTGGAASEHRDVGI